MKNLIYKIILVAAVIFAITENAQAYITVPSASVSLETGIDKFLPVPQAAEGYIDHAVWACSKSEISFKQKDEAGAIISITRAFSGTAVVEVMATERYMDRFDRMRARSYYKQYLVSCVGAGSIEPSVIVLPESITLKLGETKHFKILAGDCYNGAFSLKWDYQNPRNCVQYSVNYTTGDIDFSGVMSGEGRLIVTTADGEEGRCDITVDAGPVSSGRHTEDVAILELKSLITAVLSLANESGLDEVWPDDNSSNSAVSSEGIYDINGTLISPNATDDIVRSLAPGFYIIRGRKVRVSR